MIRTIEAIIDEQGNVKPLEPTHLPCTRRALVAILEDPPAVSVIETSLLSEPALAEDWNRSEEETAWSNLQQARQRRTPFLRQRGKTMTIKEIAMKTIQQLPQDVT